MIFKKRSKTLKISGSQMQLMYGLEPTGRLDDETRRMMAKPRCGVEDTVGVSQMMNEDHHIGSRFDNKKARKRHNKRRRQRNSRRRPRSTDEDQAKSRSKRYSLTDSVWSKKNLVYKIRNYTPDMSRSQVDKSMADALQLWSDVSKLTFTRAKRDEKGDINISFGSGNHGDDYPFDGRGNILAHAFFPENGEAHFDEDEQFDYEDGEGVNLMIVAAHEFGHSLGLAHSNVANSLMAPVYQGYVENYKLHQDDITAIQQLYGKNDRRNEIVPTTSPYTAPTTSVAPKPGIDICTKEISFDAAFYDDRDSSLYAFKGKHFWKFDKEGRFNGYPQLIRDYWRELTGDIDAVAHSKNTQRTYFFKRDKIYRYHNFNLERGFPMPLSSLRLPKNVDAAFQWNLDGLFYVFKKKNYFRFDEYQQYDGRKRYSHRRIGRHWFGVPNNLDGAIQWADETHLFKDNLIYKFDNKNLEVARNYPKNLMKYFIRCPNSKSQPLKFRKRRPRNQRSRKS